MMAHRGLIDLPKKTPPHQGHLITGMVNMKELPPKEVDLHPTLPNLTLEAFLKLDFVSSYIKAQANGQLVHYQIREDKRMGQKWTCRYILGPIV